MEMPVQCVERQSDTMKPWIAILVLTLAFADQAPAQDAEGRRGSLFISPCGRPYRAAPGEPYPVAVWFKEADRDHDGFLEKGELRADAAAFFAVLDSNHDGVIDIDEVNAYERILVPEILRGRPQASGEARLFLAQMGGGGGGGGRGGHHKGSAQAPAKTPDAAQSEMVGAAPYDLLAEPEPVTAADTNFDGRITLAEFLAAADRRFDILDVRQTGKIAFDDLPKTAVQTRPRGGEHRRPASS
jgi:hypothetical protein